MPQFEFDVAPVGVEGKGTIAVVLKVAGHGRGIDAVSRLVVERVEDLRGIRLQARGLALLLLPILHDHGNAGSAAAIFGLRHKRHVEPEVGRSGVGREGERRKQKYEYHGTKDGAWDGAWHCVRPSTHGDDDENEGGDTDQDDEEIVVADAAGGKVILGFQGAS